ncbi:pirin family protein, partial [uncultured Acinetobacter sp.]
GNEEYIHAGEWQLMSAGTGVQHSEINNTDEPVHLFQIWIQPNIRNAEPSYQQIKLDPHAAPNQWHLIVGPDDTAPMFIRQNAEVKAAVLEAGQSLEIATTKKHNFVHVVSGQIMIEDQIVKAGDALLFNEKTAINALEDSEMIWFDLPA